MADPISFDPADVLRDPIPFDPKDAYQQGGSEPVTAINESPPDPDFPSRFLLQLGTTGPDQIVQEIKRRGFEAVADADGIKVQSKNGQWYRFDPSGWQGPGELWSDITDVVPEALSTAAQVGGGLAGAALAAPTANPLAIGAAGVAGASAGSAAEDFLRTQLLGRALGYQPELEESLKSAGKEAAIGGATQLGGMALRPFLPATAASTRGALALAATRPGSALLRGLGETLQFPYRVQSAAVGMAKPFFPGSARRFLGLGPFGLTSALGGGFGAGLKSQAAIYGGKAIGNILSRMSEGQLLNWIGANVILTQSAPPAIARTLFRVSNALHRGGINAGRAALAIALRTPGVREWLEENLGATPVASGGPQVERENQRSE